MRTFLFPYDAAQAALIGVFAVRHYSIIMEASHNGEATKELNKRTMRITGKISQVLPLQQGVSSQGAQWRKLTIVVVEADPSIAFPNEVALDLFNDKIPVDKELTVGQLVDVHFGIRTREYNGKVYNDVNVFKLKIEN